jgi:uncharacterized protein (TIGR03085 family)
MTTGSSRPANALAVSERVALADLMVHVGPDAPTLCGDWTARDLAAHLIVRATRPDAAAGILLSPLAGWNARVMSGVARRDWPALVAEVRQGPPRWSPQSLAVLDSETNTVEYFVHHEDVRRATEQWEPRALDDEDLAMLWARGVRLATHLLRRCPVGVVAAPTDGPAAGTERTLRAREPRVVLAGPVGEIVLALYGRPTKGLELRGADADVEAFRDFPR